MNNKKGFTLIEILSVIILLGILLIIAVPAVSNYISGSRKSAYIDTIKSMENSAKQMIYDKEIKLFDKNTTYYISSGCLKMEGHEAESPYGKFSEAYIIATYDGKKYTYYFTGFDETGQGVKKIVNIEDIKEEDIEPNLKTSDFNFTKPVENKTKIVKFNNSCVAQTIN